MDKEVKVFDVLKFTKELGEVDFENWEHRIEASLLIHKFLQDGDMFMAMHGESLEVGSMETLTKLLDTNSLGYVLQNAFVDYEVESELDFRALYRKALSLLSPYFKIYTTQPSSSKFTYKGKDRYAILTPHLIIYLNENYEPISYLDVDYQKKVININLYSESDQQEMADVMDDMENNGIGKVLEYKDKVESLFSAFMSGRMSDVEFDDMVDDSEDGTLLS